jgi:2,4-dichlorophenol 6-monooxygenase
MKTVECEVLIVGAGLTGASLAAFLGRAGVKVSVVALTRWVADSPRAHLINSRTMEILRDQGMEELAVRQEVPQWAHANKLWTTSLAGVELARIHCWGSGPDRRGDYERASVSPRRFIEQETLEPVLLGEALRHGARVRFETEFLGFTEDADGVTARVRDLDLNEQYEIRAKYLVGADGARSVVARMIDLPMLGESAIGTAINVRFAADLTRYVAHRPASLYSVYLPAFGAFGGSGTLRLVRPYNRWVAIFPEIAHGTQDFRLDAQTAIPIIHRMIGDDSVAVQIEGISRWLINHVVAESYSSGRVFCAGDAVHRHPPMNGLGANTCIQDSYNLAWKMSYVLRNKAAESLLETYSVERQPAGKITVDRANKSFAEDKKLSAVMGVRPGQTAEEHQAARDAMLSTGAQGQALRRRWAESLKQKQYTYNALGVEMNTRYLSAAIAPDGTPEPVFDTDPELFVHDSTWPGYRLPHAWLEMNRQRVSTHDLCGRGEFALLTGLGGESWIESADNVARRLNLQISCRQIGMNLAISDPYGDWADVRGIDDDGCVLVRPDLHVGWRCVRLPDDAEAQLFRALCQILGLVHAVGPPLRRSLTALSSD